MGVKFWAKLRRETSGKMNEILFNINYNKKIQKFIVGDVNNLDNALSGFINIKMQSCLTTPQLQGTYICESIGGGRTLKFNKFKY